MLGILAPLAAAVARAHVLGRRQTAWVGEKLTEDEGMRANIYILELITTAFLLLLRTDGLLTGAKLFLKRCFNTVHLKVVGRVR